MSVALSSIRALCLDSRTHRCPELGAEIPNRVLMTTDTVGGIWNYSMSLIKSLGPHGVEVVLATMGPRPNADQRLQAQAIPNVYLVESDFKLEWMDDPWSDVADASEWLLQLEFEWQPALIHLSGYSHAALPWRAPRLVVGHSCILSWWDAVHQEPAPARWDTYAASVAAGLRSADLVIAPTAAMLGDLRRLYGWQGPGAVIWNGFDAGDGSLDRKEDYVLTAGRLWDKAKNLSALESIASQLPWAIYAAGEDECAPQKALVRRLGYLPPARIADWMKRASIYAMPARYEPFGLSILEAASFGCALVLGDISSLRELWHGAAWFVGADDHSELQHALATLIADPGLCRQFGRRARERASQYGLRPMAQNYLAVYSQLLASTLICE